MQGERKERIGVHLEVRIEANQTCPWPQNRPSLAQNAASEQKAPIRTGDPRSAAIALGYLGVKGGEYAVLISPTKTMFGVPHIFGNG
jgi:hypothetical protein